MKTLSLIFSLLFLGGCLEQTQQRVRNLLGQTPESVEQIPEDDKPVAAPASEEDKIIQLTPRERCLSLLEQFSRSPDETLKGIVLAEFTERRALFTAKADAELVHGLNRLVSRVQQGDSVTIHFLVQLHPLFLGENKEHLRGVLARAFDSVPNVAADLLARAGEDKLCILINLVPAEVSAEAKRDFLMARWQALQEIKNGKGTSAAGLVYVDACLKTLELTLSPSGEPVGQPPIEEPIPAVEQAAEPATP